MPEAKKLRIAAMADIHYKQTPLESFQPVFADVAGKADVLLLCGDLTDYGLPEEAEVVTRELSTIKIPILAVLGNHDYESGREAEVRDVLTPGACACLTASRSNWTASASRAPKGFAAASIATCSSRGGNAPSRIS